MFVSGRHDPGDSQAVILQEREGALHTRSTDLDGIYLSTCLFLLRLDLVIKEA